MRDGGGRKREERDKGRSLFLDRSDQNRSTPVPAPSASPSAALGRVSAPCSPLSILVLLFVYFLPRPCAIPCHAVTRPELCNVVAGARVRQNWTIKKTPHACCQANASSGSGIPWPVVGLRLLDTPIDQRTQGRSLMIVYGGALVKSASHNASMNPTATPTEPAT